MESEISFHTALKLFTYQIIKQEKEEIRAIHKGHHRQIGSRKHHPSLMWLCSITRLHHKIIKKFNRIRIDPHQTPK